MAARSASPSRSPTICSTSKSDAATVGKATGKDAAIGKATLVGMLGVEAARERLLAAWRRRKRRWRGFGERGAKSSREAAHFVAAREK